MIRVSGGAGEGQGRMRRREGGGMTFHFKLLLRILLFLFPFLSLCFRFLLQFVDSLETLAVKLLQLQLVLRDLSTLPLLLLESFGEFFVLSFRPHELSGQVIDALGEIFEIPGDHEGRRGGMSDRS
jgi:hypothetical protein